MNDAVGKGAPRHLCIESRMFCTRTPWTKKRNVVKKEKVSRIPSEYMIVRTQCEEYGISYTALCRARERHQIDGVFIDGKLCMKRRDVDAYIRSPRKRGRPPRRNV